MKDATSILLYFTYSLHFLNLFLDSTSFRKHRKPSGLEREREDKDKDFVIENSVGYCNMVTSRFHPAKPGEVPLGFLLGEVGGLRDWRGSWWFLPQMSH